MFLKKRHHADIMARLHSNARDSVIPSGCSGDEDDDSGFGSDLVIDEDYDTTSEDQDMELKFSLTDKENPVIEQVHLLLNLDLYNLSLIKFMSGDYIFMFT